MLANVLLWTNVGILVLLVISLVFIFISRKFESKDFQGVSDMLTISLIVFGLIVLFDLVKVTDSLGHFSSFLGGIDLVILTTITNVALIPLAAILFLGAALSLRELSK